MTNTFITALTIPSVLLHTLVKPNPSYKLNTISRLRHFNQSIVIYIPRVLVPFLI